MDSIFTSPVICGITNQGCDQGKIDLYLLVLYLTDVE